MKNEPLSTDLHVLLFVGVFLFAFACGTRMPAPKPDAGTTACELACEAMAPLTPAELEYCIEQCNARDAGAR